jgi:hypothetical protein
MLLNGQQHCSKKVKNALFLDVTKIQEGLVEYGEGFFVGHVRKPEGDLEKCVHKGREQDINLLVLGQEQRNGKPTRKIGPNAY